MLGQCLSNESSSEQHTPSKVQHGCGQQSQIAQHLSQCPHTAYPTTSIICHSTLQLEEGKEYLLYHIIIMSSSHITLHISLAPFHGIRYHINIILFLFLDSPFMMSTQDVYYELFDKQLQIVKAFTSSFFFGKRPPCS